MTIYDIAKEAGVSPSTVSRVLNNNSNLRDSTRIKVQKILDKYNYSPNELARALSLNSMNTICIVITDVRNDHHASIAFKLDEHFRNLGYWTILCNIGKWHENKASMLKNFSKRGLDGIVFIGSIFINDIVKDFIKTKIPNTPVVFANGYMNLPNVCGVISDETKGIENSFDHLIDNGYNKIAFVSDNNTLSAKNKEKGYLNKIKEYKMEKNIFNTEFGFFGGYNIGSKIINAKNIDAIIFTEDITATGTVSFLCKHGKLIPKDYGIVGFNNSIYSISSFPQLTTIDLKIEETCTTLSNIMSEKIKGNVVPNTIFSETVLIKRESTNRKEL